MVRTIRNRFDGSVIWEGEAESFGAAVEAAVKGGVSLNRSRLWECDLSGRNLSGADLRGAYLSYVKLNGVDLTNADLRGAVLFNTSFSGANLTGVKVDADIPELDNIDARIADAIMAGGKLRMGNWHDCDTAHCRAGWAIHLCGIDGYALQDKVGPACAGALIYFKSRPGKPIPDFYCMSEVAMADILACAAEQRAGREKVK